MKKNIIVLFLTVVFSCNLDNKENLVGDLSPSEACGSTELSTTLIGDWYNGNKNVHNLMSFDDSTNILSFGDNIRFIYYIIDNILYVKPNNKENNIKPLFYISQINNDSMVLFFNTTGFSLYTKSY